jgi:uncharacterized protein YkwD/uncharacterized membrane protein
MTINFIDIFLVLIILLSAFNGWRRGFVLGIFDIIRWFGSIAAAFILYNPVAGFFSWLTDWSEIWTLPLAFLFVFFATGFLIQYLGNLVIKRLPANIFENRINKIFGILPGIVSGAILAVILSALFYSLPFGGAFQNSLQDSQLAEQFAVYSDDLESALSPIFEEAVAQTLTHRLTTHPGSNESVELPFKVTKFRERPDLEAEMLDLINKERTENGLKPLEADTEMHDVAEKHSADMFERGYFAHDTPEGESPFDRMHDDNVKFKTAGENLALAPTLKIAHTGLMNSPGHRENILRPQFGRVGIGILDGGRRGLMITQNFRN